MRTFFKIITVALCITAAVNTFLFMMVGFMSTSFISDEWATGTVITDVFAAIVLVTYCEIYKVKFI